MIGPQSAMCAALRSCLAVLDLQAAQQAGADVLPVWQT